MNKNCSKCGTSFDLTKEDLQLYKQFQVEPSSMCFDCRQKHRLSFRNERVLYTRKCDATGENIVSIYSQDKPYKVFKSDYWYGDKWNPMEYGMDFDFNKTFFEQFKELHQNVPRISLMNVNAENSEYCNMSVGNRNCYLVFGGDFNEDCMYGTLCMHNRDSLDIDFSNHNELAYMMDNSMDCYDCQFVWDSRNCNNCYFVSDCIGSNECIFSFNLKNKSYCIGNQQLSKEEYFEKKKEILNGSYKKQQENLQKFLEERKKRIVKYGHILACENCTGDYLKNNKNCHNCFDVSDSEDIRDNIFCANAKDCFNTSLIGDRSELIYNSWGILGSTNVRNSYFAIDSSGIDNSHMVINSHNIFGCNGIRQKRHCIFNKQYSKEDFESLREKIIEHMKKTSEWGKFFPKEHSAFAYNESTAMRYYPMDKEQALKEGFKWKEEDPKSYNPQTCQVPDNISEVKDSISDEILACEECSKNYKILPKEFEFYKQVNLPIPRSCPECRHMFRMAQRNAFKLYDRNCMKCDTAIKTTYSPERTETVYCEKCYLKELI